MQAEFAEDKIQAKSYLGTNILKFTDKHNIVSYLNDALHQLSIENPENPSLFLYKYFDNIRKGIHVIHRDYSFIKLTVHNKECFYKHIVDLIRNETYNIDELENLTNVISYNFPRLCFQRLDEWIKYLDRKSSKNQEPSHTKFVEISNTKPKGSRIRSVSYGNTIDQSIIINSLPKTSGTSLLTLSNYPALSRACIVYFEFCEYLRTICNSSTIFIFRYDKITKALLECKQIKPSDEWIIESVKEVSDIGKVDLDCYYELCLKLSTNFTK